MDNDFRIINKGYSEISVDLLDPHPMNPNQGDLSVIDESVGVNGFYGAVVVRQSPDDHRRYQILAGEHRWRAALGREAEFIPCIVVDAPDEVIAARIMLVDNESAKRSSYIPDRLTQVLRMVGSIEGTGFDLAPLENFEDGRVADEPPDDDEVQFVREYGVVVVCEDEDQQRKLYEEFRERGLSVRVASI